MHDISRRFFISSLSATSLGAFSGCRFFRDATGTFASGVPDLKFGVVSDVHVRYVGEGKGYGGNETLRKTFEWFRDQGADAVMIVGDMADFGMVEELEAVAQAWYAAFPDDKAPDGRKVEKLFVLGNHDYHGYLYGDHAEKKYPDAAERVKHVLRRDIKANWERIFHEEYSRFYRKLVKGYTFLGAHWDDGKGLETKYGNNTFGVELKAFLDAHGAALDPERPFFYFQHPHPKDTCYGSWAWGHDNGRSTAALSSFANAIAFSGHSHYSLTDERSIWQGAFTSVGTSSLRYTGLPYDQRLPHGYENTPTEGRKTNEEETLKVMSSYADCGSCRQGMLWSVYSDRIVVKRREFLSGLDCGDDWVMPLPAAESRPFAFAGRAGKSVAPEFAAGATVALERTKAKTRAVKGHPAVEKPCVRLTFPAAFGKSGSARPYEYLVSAEGKDGKRAEFNVMAEGFNLPLATKRAKGPSSCLVPLDRLPAGTTKFTVTPMDCWWNRGPSIAAAFDAAAK